MFLHGPLWQTQLGLQAWATVEFWLYQSLSVPRLTLSPIPALGSCIFFFMLLGMEDSVLPLSHTTAQNAPIYSQECAPMFPSALLGTSSLNPVIKCQLFIETLLLCFLSRY